MRLVQKLCAVMAAFALAGGMVSLDGALQRANAEPQSIPAPQRAKPNGAIAGSKAAPARPEPLVYMSEAYLKREQQIEDRLKRAMNICKGC